MGQKLTTLGGDEMTTFAALDVGGACFNEDLRQSRLSMQNHGTTFGRCSEQGTYVAIASASLPRFPLEPTAHQHHLPPLVHPHAGRGTDGRDRSCDELGLYEGWRAGFDDIPSLESHALDCPQNRRSPDYPHGAFQQREGAQFLRTCSGWQQR